MSWRACRGDDGLGTTNEERKTAVREDGALLLQRIRELEAQLSEANERLAALEWTPITAENLPTGHNHLLYAEAADDSEDIFAIGYFNRLAMEWFVDGVKCEDNTDFTHFCKLTPPTTPTGSAE